MSGKYLDHSLFQRSWSQGEPVVVTDIQHILQGRWTPEYFVEVYGREKITIVDCESEQQYKSTVADFFLSFGAAEERKQVLKLKVRYKLHHPCSYNILVSGLATAAGLPENFSRTICGFC
jgi:hypothetical protein